MQASCFEHGEGLGPFVELFVHENRNVEHFLLFLVFIVRHRDTILLLVKMHL